jgi:hypothetical protein
MVLSSVVDSNVCTGSKAEGGGTEGTRAHLPIGYRSAGMTPFLRSSASTETTVVSTM